MPKVLFLNTWSPKDFYLKGLSYLLLSVFTSLVIDLHHVLYSEHTPGSLNIFSVALENIGRRKQMCFRIRVLI